MGHFSRSVAVLARVVCLPAATAIVAASCGGSSGGGASPSSDGGVTTGGDAAADGSLPIGSDAMVAPPADGAVGSCLGSTLLGELGKNHLLVGGSMEDATAAMAPFDARYIYISGGLFDGTEPCTSCTSNCTTGGRAARGEDARGGGVGRTRRKRRESTRPSSCRPATAPRRRRSR